MKLEIIANEKLMKYFDEYNIKYEMKPLDLDNISYTINVDNKYFGYDLYGIGASTIDFTNLLLNGMVTFVISATAPLITESLKKIFKKYFADEEDEPQKEGINFIFGPNCTININSNNIDEQFTVLQQKMVSQNKTRQKTGAHTRKGR